MLLTEAVSLVGALRRLAARQFNIRSCCVPFLLMFLGASVLGGAVGVLTPDIVLSHDRGDGSRSNLSLSSPQITWTPASIDEERGLGQTKSKTVSFSSSENLENVEIYVSPGLRQLVRVHPTRFHRVDQGQNILVSITIVAPLTTSLGKANGSIQLVRNSLRPGVLFDPLPVTVLVNVAPFPSDPGVPGKSILAASR